MSYFERNECEICGIPISDGYSYCRDHSRSNCKCGNSKYRDDEMCSSCKVDLEKKKFGFGICPICGGEYKFSEYLHTAISDEKIRLIANLITHYRHEHQKSWESQYKYISSYCQNSEFEYAKAKSEHNNRAKRQILRKCKGWIEENKLTKNHFLALQDNDEKTIELINKSFTI